MMNRLMNLPVHALRALLVLVLLTAGCAHSGRVTEGDETARQTEQRPDASVLRGDQIQRSGENTVERILDGRIPGVALVRGPNGMELRIRGATSLYGSNAPLVVIDGVPLSRGYTGMIPVSPYDIDSIRVLKSAAETAFYGSRGANGVILITTKRGPS